MSLNLGPG